MCRRSTEVADERTCQSPEEVASDGGRSRLNEVLDCLSGRRRRYALYALDESEPLDIDDLARRVAARERGVSPPSVSDDDFESVRLDLLHTHLPKLAHANIVEFDARSGSVRFRDPPRVCAKLLGICRKLERDA